jgi:cell division protein FtsB
VTAPARTATSTRGRTTAPARRRDPVSSAGRDPAAQRGRSPAVARAYARRAQRTGVHRAGPGSTDTGRTPFVMLVMALLAVTLVATLWLSTAATADSYHLQNARKAARQLTERSESLSRQVATLETAPELARRARELGMVPAGDAARLVVRPDGGVVLIGQPRRATAPAPSPAQPVIPTPPQAGPTPPQAGPTPAGQVPSQPAPAPPQPVTPLPATPATPLAGVAVPPVTGAASPVPSSPGRN